MRKHTPTPWGENTHGIQPECRFKQLSFDDYNRAAECVNACADVENPAELIEQATQCVTVATQIMEENAAIKAMLRQICAAFGDLSNRPTFKSLNDAERRSIKLAREYLVKSESES
jgi:hypothetical protein